MYISTTEGAPKSRGRSRSRGSSTTYIYTSSYGGNDFVLGKMGIFSYLNQMGILSRILVVSRQQMGKYLMGF